MEARIQNSLFQFAKQRDFICRETREQGKHFPPTLFRYVTRPTPLFEPSHEIKLPLSHHGWCSKKVANGCLYGSMNRDRLYRTMKHKENAAPKLRDGAPRSYT